MLTAKEARNLASNVVDVNKAVSEILGNIRKQAATGKYVYLERGYDFGSGKCYSRKDLWPEHCKQIVSELEQLGFKCKIEAIERQFVDMWLEVSW